KGVFREGDRGRLREAARPGAGRTQGHRRADAGRHRPSLRDDGRSPPGREQPAPVANASAGAAPPHPARRHLKTGAGGGRARSPSLAVPGGLAEGRGATSPGGRGVAILSRARAARLRAMRHLPVFLDVADRPCLVVGGGAVAARKAEALLRAGARVTLVAPLVGPEVESLARADGRLTLHRRPYEVADMAGCWLAYAATDDPAVQERVARDAERERVWLNAVDEPERCSFVMPAILERGRVTVAVGTGGASPLLAAAIRDEMALHVGPEHAAAADELAALRARFAPGAARRAAFASMLAAGLLEALRRGDAARVAEITREACAELEARADGPAGLP